MQNFKTRESEHMKSLTCIMLPLFLWGCSVGFLGEAPKVDEGVKVSKDMNGWTVERCLKRLSVSLQDATYIDEPPGVLRKLRFSVYSPVWDTNKIIVYLKDDASIFSIERDWSNADVRKAIVSKVVYVKKLPVPLRGLHLPPGDLLDDRPHRRPWQGHRLDPR